MIHPSELLRTNSFEGREFSAPANITTDNNIDCGLTNLPCLNRFNLEKFAKPRVFVLLLSLVGFLHGINLTYFRTTAHTWAHHYNISQGNVDWLIYTNEVFVGILALTVAYWGNRIHRISWIGGTTVLYSIASIVLIVPESYIPNYANVTNIVSESYICNSIRSVTTPEVNYIALVVLVSYQIFASITYITFICHGLTYLDDNTTHNSIVYIAIVLATREVGVQAGIYSGQLPYYVFDTNTVFLSVVWIIIAITTFLAGSMIAMFPRSLPSVLMRKMAASIVDLASGLSITSETETIDGLFKTLWRLLRNKILMINIFCMVLLQSALINFNIFENIYNQSRFNISTANQSTLIEFTTNLLKQPLVAIWIIASGMVIAKTKPHLTSLIKWNIAVLVLVTIFFASTAFLNCDSEIQSEFKGLASRPLCSSHCDCSYNEFRPVCVDSKTFHSPCLAGCTQVVEFNSQQVYRNCSCGSKPGWRNYEGYEGACNTKKCTAVYLISKTNQVISTALLASTLITNLVINLGCVLPNDKALTLGLEATLTSLIPYLPIKIVYGVVAGQFCTTRGDNNSCIMYSKNLGFFLSISTITLIILSLILTMVLLVVSRNKFFVDDSIDDTANNEDNNFVPTASNSLLEMENVGDDHDSVDMHLNSNRQRRRQPIESDL